MKKRLLFRSIAILLIVVMMISCLTTRTHAATGDNDDTATLDVECYYYNQLNEYEKVIYDALVENYETGETRINVDFSVCENPQGFFEMELIEQAHCERLAVEAAVVENPWISAYYNLYNGNGFDYDYDNPNCIYMSWRKWLHRISV